MAHVHLHFLNGAYFILHVSFMWLYDMYMAGIDREITATFALSFEAHSY